MKKAFIASIIALCAVSTAFAFYVVEKDVNETARKVDVSLIIDFNNGTRWQFNLTLEGKNVTVFDALNGAAKQGGFDIKATYYGQFDSYFVDSIAGIGGNGKYWLYYVNGNFGDVGADKKVLEEGDLIEWRLEEFS